MQDVELQTPKGLKRADSGMTHDEAVDAVENTLVRATLDRQIEADMIAFGDDPAEFGPLCACITCPAFLSIFCCNAHFMGCHACIKEDRKIMLIFTIVLIALVVPAVLLGIAEGHAGSKLTPDIESIVTATSALMTVFLTTASFLGLGLVAMLGHVRTAEKDATKQAKADYITGKLLQVTIHLSIHVTIHLSIHVKSRVTRHK